MGKKKKTIVVGLKSHCFSREMFLRLLTLFVAPGDNVLAVHVEELNDEFDTNSFHIHEDICKSKQVDLQVKVCSGDSFMVVLLQQVRVHFATTLAIGCSSPRPKESIVTSCLKGLPPTCSLLVMDNAGRIIVQKQGTSQQGSSSQNLQPSRSSPSLAQDFYVKRTKSLPVASSSKSPLRRSSTGNEAKNAVQLSDPVMQKQFEKLALLEVKGVSKRFTLQELKNATHKFSPQMMIGEGGYSKVYMAKFGGSQAAAVKVLQITETSGEDLLREVKILSGLNHDNIVQLIGYCYSTEMHAVVYNLLQGSLKQNLAQLKWSERMRIAVGVAKALEYLHHSCSPPIIHRDVKSSNILLSSQYDPQLSDFGASILHYQHQQPTSTKKPIHVVGTFGYMAPEYMMYGKIDEKIDVYSYGVVLLELISGKDAIQSNQASNHASLVLWARSLLSRGLCDHLVDPHLGEDYNKEEMQRMMMAARLCLMHSSSRRPPIRTIRKLLEEPEHQLNMLCEREELANETSSNLPKYVHDAWEEDE